MSTIRSRIATWLASAWTLARHPWAMASLLALVFVCESALARPGGGQTFGGGSSDGGGRGGGGGGGEIVFLLIRLIIVYPQVGIPVLIVVLIVAARMKKQGFESWDTASGSGHPRVPVGQERAPDLRALLALDPDFSQIIFEDFVYRLYASAYRAGSDARAREALAPYLAEGVREALAGEGPVGTPATNVVVGSMRVTGMRLPPTDAPSGKVRLTLQFESNVTYHAAQVERTFYLRETWLFSRDKDARTKPPEETEKLGCPNCGAPFESGEGGRCRYCGQVVGGGRFAWVAAQRNVLSRSERPPALTSEVAERGTHLPTIVDEGQLAAFAALKARDEKTDEASIEARLRLIYDTLNRAYSELDLAPARGLLSDGMFDYLRYWTEAYRAQGLRNVLERMRITRVERAKVVADRYYDAITYRLWATGLDYTIDTRTNQRVTGSADRERAYSEYWTLIRGSGARGKALPEATCPNCAAPLSVTMAGNCSYCSAHITRGEFDWVLSKIEQDDVYEG